MTGAKGRRKKTKREATIELPYHLTQRGKRHRPFLQPAIPYYFHCHSSSFFFHPFRSRSSPSSIQRGSPSSPLAPLLSKNRGGRGGSSAFAASGGQAQQKRHEKCQGSQESQETQKSQKGQRPKSQGQKPQEPCWIAARRPRLSNFLTKKRLR